MGKPKGKASKRARKLARKKGLTEAGDSAGPSYSVDDLLDRAQEVLDQCELDLARKFCQRALEMESDNVRALEMTASLLLEAGDGEGARHCLGRAVTVQPDRGHSKFLSLAQLFDGKEAMQLYNSGIEIIQKELEGCADDAKRKELSLELSNAYCACAELFMTDLCDEDAAEQSCKSSIARAEEASPVNPEAKQTKARFLIVKEQFNEAKAAMQESLSLWLPNYQAVLENKEGAAGEDFDPVESCLLLYTTRIATAKILIELEMWDEATQVLEGLLEEDDEVVDTWYLLGWLNRLRATGEGGEEGYNGNARFYLDKAKKAHKARPTDDDEMVSHIDELLTELGPEVEEDKNGDAAEDGTDDWEDLETDSEEEEEMEQS